jgi:hypothetical protein
VSEDLIRHMDPGAPILNSETDESGWVLAGFDGVCFWGDWIVPGDVVQYVWLSGWEHRECHEAEKAVFQGVDR